MSVLNSQEGRDKVRDFIEINEGKENKVYLDGRGIPAVGIGHALVTNQNGTWVVRPDLVSDFRDAGILPSGGDLSASDLQRLESAANNLNNSNGGDNVSIIDSSTAWDFYPEDATDQLTDDQVNSLFDNNIGDYENITIDRLGQGAKINRQNAEALWERLSENQQTCTFRYIV